MTSKDFRTLDSYVLLVKLSEAITKTRKNLNISKCKLLKVARGNNAIIYYTTKKKITVSLYGNNIVIEVRYNKQTKVDNFGLMRSNV